MHAQCIGVSCDFCHEKDCPEKMTQLAGFSLCPLCHYRLTRLEAKLIESPEEQAA
jgi:hypothetical protein